MSNNVLNLRPASVATELAAREYVANGWVLVPSSAEEPAEEGAEGRQAETVMRMARELVESGEGRRLALNELIEACVDQVPRDPQAKCDNRRRDFMRAIEALVAANQVEVSDGYVRLQ